MMRVPSVLLLDDGALESVHEALDRLDVEVVWRNARVVRPWIVGKHELLITTALCALASENVFRATPRHERPVWITFHNQDFLPFRERLRRVGVDYLVHTAVQPELLRLLLLRVLFRDDERRGAQRLPAGTSVSCQLGDRQLATTLAEISPGGCLLLSPVPVERDVPVVLELPVALGNTTNENRIPGRVARVQRIATEAESALWKLAIEFDRASDSPASLLDRLGAGRAIGSRVTCFQVEPVAAVGPGPRPASAGREARPAVAWADVVQSEDVPHVEAAPGLEDALQQEEVVKDRRNDPRAGLGGRKITLVDEESGIVFGRDLSRRGVRIERCDAMTVGDTLTLAIPGRPPEEPLLLRAVVARDEGADGLVVLFNDPEPADLDRLDRIVASLPPIETLADDPLVSERVLVVGDPERS